MTNRKIFVLSVCLILISGFVFKTWAQGPEPAKKVYYFRQSD